MAIIPTEGLASTLVADILAASKSYKPTGSLDPKGDFLSELNAAGFKAKPPLVIGKIVRVDAPDDKRGQKTGWYIYNEFDDKHNDGHVFGVGVYGSWRMNPEKVTWTSKDTRHMSDEERGEYHAQLEAAREARDIEQAAIHAEAAIKAFEIWKEANKDCTGNAYLARKGVQSYQGIRQSRGELVVPVCDATGFMSLQFIKPDGAKKFLTGGKIKGGWFCINGHTDTIYIAEGYATGASIVSATGSMVYIAFNCGNLYEVATTVKKRHPESRVVIAGDDDRFTDGNPGRTKAEQAASALGMEVMFPSFKSDDGKGVDWNDLHAQCGIKEVGAQLSNRPRLYKQKDVVVSPTDIDMFSPPGIMDDICTYYHATSGNSQPGFAVMTALALVSVVCARNFETNYSNRSSLYLLNIGKSGTGKEHPKKVIEKVLEAAGCADLISGEGYTSGGGVISALSDKPRHLTIIDEFSKYIQAAQSKNSNANYIEANTQMMKVITSLDGTLRPKNYSTIGITKEKKKEYGQAIVNPAITLMAMSTPDDLFKSVNVGSIKDGFWNRFIIHVSDAERSLREIKEPLPVPDAIPAWIRAVNSRRAGGKDEASTEKPALVTLRFTTDAIALYRDFNQWQIDKANALERFGMDDLPGRAPEMALRIALCVALAKDPMAESITADDMQWAIGWVKFNFNRLAERMKMMVSGSDFEARKLESLAAIRKAGEKGVSRKELNTMKPFSTYDMRQRKEVIDGLVEAELIQLITRDSTGGRPATAYVAIES